jgi:hypothetical protein
VLNELGDYLFTAAITQRVPTQSAFAWTGVAPAAASAYATEGQDHLNQHGVREHFTRPVATSRAFAFRTAAGTLVCGTLNQEGAVSSPTGGLFQDRDRHNWGPSIEPGVYAQLNQTFSHSVCLTIQHDGTRVVSSIYGTETSITPAIQRQMS